MFFWLGALLLTLLIALIGFYPLLLSRRQWHIRADKDGINRDALNKALYFNRLQEIERDEGQGLLEDSTLLKTELQRTLLEDIPEQQAAPASAIKAQHRLWFVSAVLTLCIIAGGVYFKTGAWQAEAMLEKTYQKLPHFYQRLQEEESKPLSEAEMQQFATALRIKLQKNPQDAQSWWLLGQLGMGMSDGQLALDSYAKAVKLQPQNNEYKIAYARILMFSEDSYDKSRGEEMLKQVIRADHTNTQALSLLAFRYFEAEQYKMAAVTWAMMLRLMDEQDPRRGLIEKSIRSARDAQAELELNSKSSDAGKVSAD
ncbi:cytochrome c-type biogenesis protein CcmH [Mesocricetibacter intestinalis]|uniref:Cytochrome c-type biogenesis protein CcmH n=1 Tax=Mesocricetibacter intestinalis TaxID=1521930 RepID=A0A4R6VBK7_9PAST|nr:c-type cytochrome biogenesis protein CcmI [Mesocricetibacter intestinalis]TDQ59658.1 cytochrome c-type biogenesis protein CcmH [Mesocricetibacter intestinalis]